MRIDSISGSNMQNVGMNRQMGTDSVSKNIQNQIANAQKQLQELSSNKEMSIEEKMNKRQEIQQQIADLNNQLRQHQIEMRREQQQTKNSSMDDMLGGTRKVANTGNQGAGLSQASMQAIISADSAISQVQSSGRVVTKMEGRAGVLEAEIKLDSARGGNVEAKQEELAEVQQKASQAQASQMNVLANANEELEEAAKTEQKTESKEDKATIEDENTENKVDRTETMEVIAEPVSVSSDVVVESVEYLAFLTMHPLRMEVTENF